MQRVKSEIAQLLKSITKEIELNIGSIRNYYGGLVIKEEDGKYYWGIEDWDGVHYEEIPKYLYDALVQYQNTST